MKFKVAKSTGNYKYTLWELKWDGKFGTLYLPLTKINRILSIIDLHELERIFEKYNGSLNHDGRYITDYGFKSQHSARKFLDEVFIPTFIAWKLLP